MKICSHSYEYIISVENLLKAWREFLKGKKSKPDVYEFELHLMDNILNLHNDLKEGKYRHGGYKAFKINDPKPRDIHKASVRDRLLHHAIYRVLYPYFDNTFIYDSYSCRKWKGTHRAIERFNNFARIESRNHTKTIWILKCDIRKFFASINHQILKQILSKYIEDRDILKLLGEVIDSFNSGKEGIGLPLGNLTSQLFVNIYMNEFDQYMKHKVKAKYYVRYADDFVIISRNREYLENLRQRIDNFLIAELKLNLHPDKVFIKTFASGIDFLGWVNFPYHRVLRTKTKRRMLGRIKESQKEETVQSYLGLLRHGDTYKVQNMIISYYDECGKSSKT